MKLFREYCDVHTIRDAKLILKIFWWLRQAAGKDNVDMAITSDHIVQFIIKFKNITIRDTQNNDESRYIGTMYVSLTYKLIYSKHENRRYVRSLIFQDLEVSRQDWRIPDYLNGYIHPHVRSKTGERRWNLNLFCIGHNQIILLLKKLRTLPFNANPLPQGKNLMLQLRNMLSCQYRDSVYVPAISNWDIIQTDNIRVSYISNGDYKLSINRIFNLLRDHVNFKIIDKFPQIEDFKSESHANQFALKYAEKLLEIGLFDLGNRDSYQNFFKMFGYKVEGYSSLVHPEFGTTVNFTLPEVMPAFHFNQKLEFTKFLDLDEIEKYQNRDKHALNKEKFRILLKLKRSIFTDLNDFIKEQYLKELICQRDQKEITDQIFPALTVV